MREVRLYAGLAAFLGVFAAASTVARAQTLGTTPRHITPHVVVPQIPVFGPRNRPTVVVRGVHAVVNISDQAASTTLDFELHNPSGHRLQAEILVPLPDGAVVRAFTFQGTGNEPSSELLPKDKARQIYDAIVARLRDPALLEFLGYNTLRSSVFPVEAGGTQKVRLTYEQLLPIDGSRVDYILPRSESLAHSAPWRVRVSLTSQRGISAVYSPSHQLITRAQGSTHHVEIAPQAAREPGAFRLSYLFASEPVTASLLAYPDPSIGGGYFLLLGGLPAELAKPVGEGIRRDVTVVIDRSGSMQGEKLEQAREAALQVLAGLDDGEAFNIVVYNEAVDRLSATPLTKNADSMALAREYLRGVRSRGGTNIHDALLESLRLEPIDDTLPIVIFLTDGLPTIGQTAESAIRQLTTDANPHKKRVFSFGVGVDVNTPLLEHIAFTTRATSTFVLPEEDVEVKVAQVFRRLSGPLLADPQLESIDDSGMPAPGRVRDVLPTRLPDLFQGDQLVVLGQYVGDAPIRFRLRGNYVGEQRAFEFAFSLGSATTRNGHIPRLWASRKIAMLLDAVRALGAGSPPGKTTLTTTTEPRLKELMDEIIRLSVEFGILTEYTAFLARDGSDLANAGNLREALEYHCRTRAIGVRSGLGAVNQELNLARQKFQSCVNLRNTFLDADLNAVSTARVQQVSGDTFYLRSGRWIDSRLVQRDAAAPRSVIEFDSDEFRALAGRLAREGKQGTFALRGDVLLIVDGESVLLRAPRAKPGRRVITDAPKKGR